MSQSTEAEKLLKKIKEKKPDSPFNLAGSEFIVEALKELEEEKRSIPRDKKAKQEVEKDLLIKAREGWADFMGKKITIGDIAKRFGDKFEEEKGEVLSYKDSLYVAKTVFDCLKSYIEEGKIIYVHKLGTFEPVFRGGVKYHNYKTNEFLVTDLTYKYKLKPIRSFKKSSTKNINKFKEHLKNDQF